MDFTDITKSFTGMKLNSEDIKESNTKSPSLHDIDTSKNVMYHIPDLPKSSYGMNKLDIIKSINILSLSDSLKFLSIWLPLFLLLNFLSIFMPQLLYPKNKIKKNSAYVAE